MARQERAIRSKQAILEAAAQEFDERGYDGATIDAIADRAGATKGGVYFHYKNKESLAIAVLDEQLVDIVIEPQRIKLQELVDAGQVLSYLLRDNPIQRGAARLSMEQTIDYLGRERSMHMWTGFVEGILTEAKERHEVLPGVDIHEDAELYTGAFAGIQNMSQAMSGRMDLCERTAILFSRTLPSIASPAALVRIDLRPERGEEIVRRMHGAGPATTAPSSPA